MRNRVKILVLFVGLVTGLSAQQAPNPVTPVSSPLISGRDKNKEDQVAKLFETIRANAKIPPLERIKHRDSLEQTACTVAQTDIIPKAKWGFYKTLQPASISP
jgi:hypothetical protein